MCQRPSEYSAAPRRPKDLFRAARVRRTIVHGGEGACQGSPNGARSNRSTDWSFAPVIIPHGPDCVGVEIDHGLLRTYRAREDDQDSQDKQNANSRTPLASASGRLRADTEITWAEELTRNLPVRESKGTNLLRPLLIIRITLEHIDATIADK